MTTRPVPASVDPMDALVQTSFLVIALLTKAAAAHDLSLTQLRLLAILRDHEPKMAELADLLGLDRSSVSGLIDRAVARGLVTRAASTDDGRAVRVTFTADGKRLARVMTREIGALISARTGRLGSTDRHRLDALLRQLLD